LQAFGFKRETNLTDFEFGEITTATNMETRYDGFIGLKPWQGENPD
jgi:hypothetical protein